MVRTRRARAAEPSSSPVKDVAAAEAARKTLSDEGQLEKRQEKRPSLFPQLPHEVKLLILHFLVSLEADVAKRADRVGRIYLDSRSWGLKPHVAPNVMRGYTRVERGFSAVVKAFTFQHLELTGGMSQKRLDKLEALLPSVADCVQSITASATDDTLMRRFLPHLPNVSSIMLRLNGASAPKHGSKPKTLAFLEEQGIALRHFHLNVSGTPFEADKLLSAFVQVQKESLRELFVTRITFNRDSLSAFLDGLATLPHLESFATEIKGSLYRLWSPGGTAVMPDSGPVLKFAQLKSLVVHGDVDAHQMLLRRVPDTIRSISFSWSSRNSWAALEKLASDEAHGARFQHLETLELLSVPVNDYGETGLAPAIWEAFNASSVSRLVVTHTITNESGVSSLLKGLSPEEIDMRNLVTIVLPSHAYRGKGHEAFEAQMEDRMAGGSYVDHLDKLERYMAKRGVSLQTYDNNPFNRPDLRVLGRK